MARSSTTRRTLRGIIQSSQVGTIESFGKRVLRDFELWLLAGQNLRLRRRTIRWCTADPSRPYIIAILRPTGRTVSKLTELARKLEMICTAGPVPSIFHFYVKEA